MDLFWSFAHVQKVWAILKMHQTEFGALQDGPHFLVKKKGWFMILRVHVVGNRLVSGANKTCCFKNKPDQSVKITHRSMFCIQKPYEKMGYPCVFVVRLWTSNSSWSQNIVLVPMNHLKICIFCFCFIPNFISGILNASETKHLNSLLSEFNSSWPGGLVKMGHF